MSDSPVQRHYRANDPEWHWLETRDAPEVEAFLTAANAESDNWFTPLMPLADALYTGHLARRELAVSSLPEALDYYVYWSKTADDADYPVWWRHPLAADPADTTRHECLLDLQTLSRHHDFVELGDMSISPNEQQLAWTLDTSGDEVFSLMLGILDANDSDVRQKGQKDECLLDNIGPDLSWAEDGQHLLFTRYDSTQRPFEIWCLNVENRHETLLYREEDSEFWVGMGKTRSREYIVLETASKDTSESWLLPAATPLGEMTLVRGRETGVEYGVDHRPGHFYVLHNHNAPHFQLDVAPESAPGDWQPLIPTREEVTLEGVDAFSWGLMVDERDHRQAQAWLRVVEFDGAASGSDAITRDERLVMPEQPLSQGLGDCPHFDSRRLRIREESFTTPPSWIEIDLDTGTRHLLKRQTVHGDLAPDELISRRLWATSADGEQVPVSVVMRRDLCDTEGRPLAPLPVLLYGYGAYGETLDPWFSIGRLELLTRGVAFAVAHVRGGGDRGEPWYLAGKLEHKENSFHDFLAARDALVEQGVGAADRIAAYGASAGGLLVGASLNKRPDAFCAAVLDVPFVDVLRTMENPELPLTTAEYTEWGNPHESEARRRIRAYSPLDNLTAAPYPPLFLQGSWHDTRVPYWEPAKLYARLRQMDCTPHPVLLRTDMSSGHGGASGRFKAWRDNARQDAFLLWALGVSDDG
ncbi:S9 family peptidase [Cobetia crustatorum]|uniref:S9 family peptidase n=1 Tax=Cobetia crustatorum TaxID=553385 RepID=UPI00046AD4CE|nr:prolyl oligopeptidase family serine peptidase [Cobetia crustatorum]